MGILNRFKNQGNKTIYRMVNDLGNGFYSWNGKLYQSDIVRACIKPKTKAIGKAVAKHIRTTTDQAGKINTVVNPEAYMRFLLEEPNEYMTGQMMQEKVANQLQLNSNAFILILRDGFGFPCGLYPIPCTSVEAKYIDMDLHLKFYYQNGKSDTFPYTEIIHIRDDYMSNDLFGDSPTEALTDLMNIVCTIDQGIIKAIKNSAVVRWLLKFTQSLRKEDLKSNAEDFANNYLAISNNNLGVAATDAKADAVQVSPNDYVPNAAQMDKQTARIYAFFNTNDDIVHSSYNEEKWISYYEQVIEPVIMQMSEEYTRKLFSRRERGCGNRIAFEASNLSYASTSTKLAFVTMVDRGAMTPNEWRTIFNMTPIEGGDVALLRKDTGKLTEGKEENE